MTTIKAVCFTLAGLYLLQSLAIVRLFLRIYDKYAVKEFLCLSSLMRDRKENQKPVERIVNHNNCYHTG